MGYQLFVLRRRKISHLFPFPFVLSAPSSPTMAKWTKEELLCNARGLDDGYLYMHQKHPFGKKLVSLALQGNKTASSSKERLSDSSSYGFPGFTGSVRPPLSNEIHPITEDGSENIRVPLPPSASKIDRPSHDNLFSEAIHAHEAVCVAFSEPLKLSHKSILLAGAKPPPCTLTGDDLRIRRPRLNRGGGTIAHLGMSRSGGGQSHQSGYGSMNISSYERELAQKTGRGHEMYQPGVRAWGAMEPVPKRQRGGNQHPQHGPPQQMYGNNPFSAQGRVAPQQHSVPPPWQINRGRGQHQQRQVQGSVPPPPPPPPPPPLPAVGSYGRNQQVPPYNRQQQQRQHQQRPPHQQAQGQHGQRQPGFSFQSYNQQPPAGQHPPHRNNNRYAQNQQQPSSARANSNTMNDLRAQLVSTLKQNRRPGQGPNDPRRR